MYSVLANRCSVELEVLTSLKASFESWNLVCKLMLISDSCAHFPSMTGAQSTGSAQSDIPLGRITDASSDLVETGGDLGKKHAYRRKSIAAPSSFKK